MTDFIFGFGNVIFQKCNLVFCGYSDNYTEKAFITANKAADKGFLFNRCIVDYDTTLNSNVPDKKYYLGRTWGVGARTAFNKTRFNNIAIFNEDFWTEMSGSLEEAFYTESKSNEKGLFIAASNVKRNAVRASKYTDGFFSFTCKEWFNDWSPAHFEEEIQDVFYDFQCNNEGAYNESFQNTTGTWKGLTINAENGKLGPNAGANCTQMNANTVITIPVLADCIVTVKAFQGYGDRRLMLQTKPYQDPNAPDVSEMEVEAVSDIVDIWAPKGDVILSAELSTYIESICVAYK